MDNPRLLKMHDPNGDFVTLAIYNLAGERVTVLLKQRMPAGVHSLKWDSSYNGGPAPVC